MPEENAHFAAKNALVSENVRVAKILEPALVSLKKLTKFSRLKHLPIAAFEKFHYLERIYVQNNQLITLPEEVVAPFMESLVLIEMSGNPLKCDCDLAWYTDWYKNKRPPGEDPRNVICHMQSEHREYSVHELPLAKMGCGGKVYQPTKSKASTTMPSVVIIMLVISSVWSESVLCLFRGF